MRLLIVKVVWILVIIGIVSQIIPCQGAQENQSDRLSTSGYGNELINEGGQEKIQLLVDLLKNVGVDFSYGNEGGTVFSMVDQSLHQIITDLSSGNPEGAMNNSLIQETTKYLGIDLNEVIINPEEISGHMAATERYNARISSNKTSDGKDG